jgi:hypothetical protein
VPPCLILSVLVASLSKASLLSCLLRRNLALLVV